MERNWDEFHGASFTPNVCNNLALINVQTDFFFFFEKFAGAPLCHLRRRKQKFRELTVVILHKKKQFSNSKKNETKHSTKITQVFRRPNSYTASQT